ncbi:MAG: cell wall anchor protein, partial [Bacteroidales bacterium]
MKNSSIRILILLIVYIASSVGLSAQRRDDITIKATLDSAAILMGNMSKLHLEIVQNVDDNGLLLIPNNKLMTDTIELSEELNSADTITISNARMQIDRELYVQSFDSGLYLIPPFKYVVGRDTFESNNLVLKVLPVSVDSMTTVYDYKGVVAPRFNLFDYFPSIYKYWYIYLIILLLIAIGLWLYLRKRIVIEAAKPVVVIPPYDEAIMNLNSLKDQQLWQAGRDKEYYTILTDILRSYLERRFGIYAMEMTSTQIIKILKSNEETKVVNKNMQQILEIADFVKFAKVRPMPEDNERSFRNAVDFVEETKPKEVEVDAEQDDKGDKTTAD